ncbi:MAG: PepSY domain-containing protein [Anaerolineae bacterium]
MKVNKRMAGAVIGIALLMGSLGIGIALAQGPTPTAPPQAAFEESGTDEQVQSPSYTGSISVDQAQYEGVSEADEAAALQGKATISAADAEAAALAANPGATLVKTELDNENGVLVYSVELSSGLDVKVDAGNGQILYMEQDDDRADEASQVEEVDNDNVQEEHEDQADDAFEAPHAEDAPGQ